MASAGHFEDGLFSKALLEASGSPDLVGWDLFVAFDDTKIYRRLREGTPLYEYKLLGHLSSAPATSAEVFMDVEYRKTWDTYAKEVQVHVDETIYWQVNYPFPLSNRDYVYVRETREVSEGVFVCAATSKHHDKFPPRSGVVRVTSYHQTLTCVPDGKGGSNILVNYFDDPGGSIPSWLINFAANKGVPGYIKQLEDACLKYGDYSAKKGKK